MKKLLLTLSVAAICTSSAFSQETISAADATDIQGTFVDATSSAGAHYQPLESLKLGAYTFAFTPNTASSSSQMPAYYTGDKATIRVYFDNGITITNADADIQSIVLNCKSIAGINVPDGITTTEGQVVVNTSAKTITWTRPETDVVMNTVTLRLPASKGSDNKNPNVQINSVTFTTVGGEVTPRSLLQR